MRRPLAKAAGKAVVAAAASTEPEHLFVWANFTETQARGGDLPRAVSCCTMWCFYLYRYVADANANCPRPAAPARGEAAYRREPALWSEEQTQKLLRR